MNRFLVNLVKRGAGIRPQVRARPVREPAFPLPALFPGAPATETPVADPFDAPSGPEPPSRREGPLLPTVPPEHDRAAVSTPRLPTPARWKPVAQAQERAEKAPHSPPDEEPLTPIAPSRAEVPGPWPPVLPSRHPEDIAKGAPRERAPAARPAQAELTILSPVSSVAAEARVAIDWASEREGRDSPDCGDRPALPANAAAPGRPAVPVASLPQPGARMAPTTSAKVPEPPSIHVKIGRVEIRASQPPPQPVRYPPPKGGRGFTELRLARAYLNRTYW